MQRYIATMAAKLGDLVAERAFWSTWPARGLRSSRVRRSNHRRRREWYCGCGEDPLSAVSSAGERMKLAGDVVRLKSGGPNMTVRSVRYPGASCTASATTTSARGFDGNTPTARGGGANGRAARVPCARHPMLAIATTSARGRSARSAALKTPMRTPTAIVRHVSDELGVEPELIRTGESRATVERARGYRGVRAPGRACGYATENRRGPSGSSVAARSGRIGARSRNQILG